MLNDELNDDLLAEILSLGEPEKSWLEPLANDFRDAKLESSLDGVIDGLLDVTDTTSRAIPTPKGTIPVCGPNSFESSGFLDEGSLTGDDKSHILRNALRGVPPIPRPSSVPSMAPLGALPSPQPHTVRVRGGVWQWIPDADQPDSRPPGPPPPAPGSHRPSVPVKTGRLPMASGLDVIETFDILEMADTLIFENGRKPHSSRQSRLASNSCPVSTSLFQDDRDLSGSHTKVRSRPAPTSSAIPMTMSRSTSSKMNRCSRSQSSPHASNLLASSIPSNRGGSYGGSMGRSYSLLNSDSISEEKEAEPFDPDYEFSTMTPSYSSRSLDATGKKKHNPWTVLEAVSLINGVEEMGLGKWADIKRAPEFEEIFDLRSAVDLKDKWRNLTRLAKLPVAKLEEKVAKDLSRTGESIPLESYMQIRRLAGIS